jgi:hypothetical protein
MVDQPKTAGSTDYYDGVLSRPFLAEHWYKGFVASALSFFLLTLFFYILFDTSFLLAFVLAGAFSLLLLVAAVTQHQRFELDVTRKQYRSSLWVLGLRFGKWQPLPSIDFVKIRHYQQQHLLPLSEGNTPTINLIAMEDKWQVLLQTTGSPVGLVAAYVGQVKADSIATKLANLLHVEVYTGNRSNPLI